MLQKQDMIIALNGGQPYTAVPVWELEFHPWNLFHKNSVIVGTAFQNLPSSQQDKVLHNNAEVMIDVAEKLYFSAITVPGGYWEVAPGHPAYFWLPEKARYEQIRILKKMAPDNLMLIAGSGGILAMPSADEYVTFSCELLEYPEKIESRAKSCLNAGLETARHLFDCGIDTVYSASDLADNHGPYFNPDQMQRLILPYLSDWATTIRSMQKFCILHSDGNLMPTLDQIADSDIHALQAIDPVAGMDMKTVKGKVAGRICLCGNVDCGLLLTGTPETVYESTRALLEENKSGGGLVLGASNAVQEETPSENYLAMIEAWKRFGQYEFQ